MRPTSATPWALLLLLALGTTLFTCCDDDDIGCSDETNPECPNYDPCHDRKMPVSAAFTMGHPMPAGSIWDMFGFDTLLYAPVYDKAVPCSDITFIASDATADSYRWQVDENPANARTGRSFTMSFPDWTMGQTISVRLITERLSDSTCADVALLRDTVVRQFDMVSRANTNVPGTYRGSWSHEPDHVFDMEIGVNIECLERTCAGTNDACDTSFVFRNFFGLGCEAVREGRSTTFINGAFPDLVLLQKALDCPDIPSPYEVFQALHTHIIVYANDSIQINCKMSYSSPTAPLRLERPVFLGKRI